MLLSLAVIQLYKPFGITKYISIAKKNKIIPDTILTNIISKFHFKFVKILFLSNIS